jgi:hypothetical protein
MPNRTWANLVEKIGRLTGSKEESKPSDSSGIATSNIDRPSRPYLKIFSPDQGSFDFPLADRLITIGRSPKCDIVFKHDTVSRSHAIITRFGGDYRIEDTESHFGTVVNGRRVKNHLLKHEDTILISQYVLQYHEHTIQNAATEVASRAKQLLRSEFRLLPSSMELKYRTLACKPNEVFRSGDTLPVGQGGLLVPTAIHPGDAGCLELNLVWPNHRDKRFLGEILGVIQQDNLYWMCVKLHRVRKDIHDVIVDSGTIGDWQLQLAGDN